MSICQDFLKVWWNSSIFSSRSKSSKSPFFLSFSKCLTKISLFLYNTRVLKFLGPSMIDFIITWGHTSPIPMELCLSLFLFLYFPNSEFSTIFLFLFSYYKIHNYYFLILSRASELCLTLVLVGSVFFAMHNTLIHVICAGA